MLVVLKLRRELAWGHQLLHWSTETYPSGALAHSVPYTIAFRFVPLVDFDVKSSVTSLLAELPTT